MLLLFCDLVLVLCAYDNSKGQPCKYYFLVFGENRSIVFKGFFKYVKNLEFFLCEWMRIALFYGFIITYSENVPFENDKYGSF